MALIAHEHREREREEVDALKRALLASGVPVDVLYPQYAPQVDEDLFDSDEAMEIQSTGTAEEAMDVLRKIGTSIELDASDLFIDPELLKD